MAIDHPLFPHVNQIVIERAGDLGPEIGADMKIGRETAVGSHLETQAVAAVASHPVVDVAEAK